MTDDELNPIRSLVEDLQHKAFEGDLSFNEICARINEIAKLLHCQ